jgi:hypothetical protein
MAVKCRICKVEHSSNELGMLIAGKQYCFPSTAKAVQLYEEAFESHKAEQNLNLEPQILFIDKTNLQQVLKSGHIKKHRNPPAKSDDGKRLLNIWKLQGL